MYVSMCVSPSNAPGLRILSSSADTRGGARAPHKEMGSFWFFFSAFQKEYNEPFNESNALCIQVNLKPYVRTPPIFSSKSAAGGLFE
jgi:hypothetical protein